MKMNILHKIFLIILCLFNATNVFAITFENANTHAEAKGLPNTPNYVFLELWEGECGVPNPWVLSTNILYSSSFTTDDTAKVFCAKAHYYWWVPHTFQQTLQKGKKYYIQFCAENGSVTGAFNTLGQGNIGGNCGW
jgi:hypothetical protein